MDEHTTAGFGERLRHFRVRAGLSQAALAERANMSLAAVATLERGVRNLPYPRTVDALAAALDLSATERADLVAAARPTARLRRAPPSAPEQRGVRAPQLPVWLTSFVGREAEVEAIQARLGPRPSPVRLLTLVGPGGVGKTRLAVAAAAGLAPAYPDGVVFVDLAPLRDARLVPAAIARAVGVRESAGRSAGEVLLDALRERRLLLVLDNLEHLLPAAALLAELLGACPAVALLVTSRAALRLSAEQRFPVAPLATPAEDEPSPAAIAAAPAARLFVERARSVVPEFRLEPEGAAMVGAICRRLDGMPLAIELAAARAALLGPAVLLRRLEHRLSLLTGGPADLPERQQTLRATLAWSHDLLEPAAQVLFRRLAVFAGGWMLEAAEAVCADARVPTDEVLGQLQVLADSSLIQVHRPGEAAGESRFVLLETVREYALEQLEAAGEGDELRARHAAYLLALGEQAERHVASAEQAVWQDRLSGELDNLRAALAWAGSSGRQELGLRLAVALARFWPAGHGREALAWLESLTSGVAEPDESPQLAALHAQALGTAGWIAYLQGDNRVAKPLAEQCLARWQRLGQVGNSPVALSTLAFVAGHEGDVPRQEALFRRNIALYRAAGDRTSAAWVSTWLGTVRRAADDLEEAEALLAEALAVFEEQSDTGGRALALQHLGNVAVARRDFQRAQGLLERSLSIYRGIGPGIAYVLGDLAGLAACRGELGRAQALCEESVSLFRQHDEPRGLAAELGLLGRLTALQGDDAAAEWAYAECLRLSRSLANVDLVFVLEWVAELRGRIGLGSAQHEQLVSAARLFGAAAALRDRLGAAASRSWAIPMAPPHREAYEHQVTATRAALGIEAFETAWAEGRCLAVEQAVAEALLAMPPVADAEAAGSAPAL